MTPPADTPRQVILSWSGGKDCTLALDALLRDPHHRVVALLTTVTAGYERVSVHGVRRTLLHEQAAALRLPLFEAVIPPAATNALYDAALERALAEARAAFPEATRLAFGDIFLADVRAYREERLGALGYELLFPLWGMPTVALAHGFIAAGYAATVVCIDTEVLPGALAGRVFDATFVHELPPGVDSCGERGEFHTFVTDGPIFAAPVACTLGERVLREERFMYCDLVPAHTAAVGGEPVA